MICEGMYTDPTNFPVFFFFPFLGYKRNWNCKSLSKISKDITTLLLKYNTETFCQLNFSGCALQEVDIVSRLHVACDMVWYKTLHVDKYATTRSKENPNTICGWKRLHTFSIRVWPADAFQDVSTPPAATSFLLYVYCDMHFYTAIMIHFQDCKNITSCRNLTLLP